MHRKPNTLAAVVRNFLQHGFDDFYIGCFFGYGQRAPSNDMGPREFVYDLHWLTQMARG